MDDASKLAQRRNTLCSFAFSDRTRTTELVQKKDEEEYELFRAEKEPLGKWLNFPTTKGAFCICQRSMMEAECSLVVIAEMGSSMTLNKCWNADADACTVGGEFEAPPSEILHRESGSPPALPLGWRMSLQPHTWARHGASPLDSQRRVPPPGPRFKAFASSYCKDEADHRWPSVKQPW